MAYRLTFDRNATVREATPEETPKGHCNPPQVLEYRDRQGSHAVVIAAGTEDYVEVWRLRGTSTRAVLTYNYRLGYVGLEMVDGGEVTEEVFMQNAAEELEDPSWDDKSSAWLVRALLYYCDF